MTEAKKLMVLITVKGNGSCAQAQVFSSDLIEITRKFDVTGMAADAYGVVIQVKTYEDAVKLKKFMEGREAKLEAEKFTIYADGLISYDGTMLYHAREVKGRTRVTRREDGQVVEMPNARYFLHSKAGWKELFEDLIKVEGRRIAARLQELYGA